MTEIDRLNFVEERDGREAMLAFCIQGVNAYAKASIKYGKYKEHYDTYQKILEDNGYDIKLVSVTSPTAVR